jgi:tetratricopeptide (TPR) repeat protein
MEETPLYIVVATIYGLLGAALSASYSLSPRLREAPAYHAITAILMLGASALAVLNADLDFQRLAAFHSGARFFLFFGASLAYVPAVLFLALHYADWLLERILSPGSRKSPPPRFPPDAEAEWRLVQTYLEGLAAEPSDSGLREKLADLYAHMGFHDSAAYEYQKAAEWLERGYAHSHLLYKAANVLVERKGQTESAVILLRRIVRLYPKSYFAAYARRVLSAYEANLGAPGARADGLRGPPADSSSA